MSARALSSGPPVRIELLVSPPAALFQSLRHPERRLVVGEQAVVSSNLSVSPLHDRRPGQAAFAGGPSGMYQSLQGQLTGWK